MTTDVLIVGGGIAGSSLAILLGREGINVELFERGHFPREKACGEGIMPAGVGVLEKLGVAEAVGGMPFFGVRYHFGEKIAEGRFSPAGDISVVGRGQRRLRLDSVLFQAAAATAGVRAHIDAPVESINRENGRVTGVCANGNLYRAGLVVAADGARSRIRQQLGLDTRPERKRFGVRAHFRLALNREQPAWVDVFVGRGYELYVTPLPEREVLVAGLADSRALAEPLDRAFRRWWNSHRTLAWRLEGAKQTSKLLSCALLTGRVSVGVAPGVALLGDAASFSDPITGGGITQALQAAELLATYIASRLGTNDQWLWEFDRDRRALLRDYEVLTRMVLWLADRPQLAAWALSTLSRCPKLFSHLLGVSSGSRRLLRIESLGVKQSFLCREF